jgi:hypothetical protein
MEKQEAVEPILRTWPVEITPGRELRLDKPATIRLPMGSESVTIYVQSERKPKFRRDESK